MATRIAPVETVMSVTDTKQQFSNVVNRVARDGERVIVEKSGLPAAVIIPIDDYQRFREAEDRKREAREQFFERLARLGDAFEGVPDEVLELEIRRAQAEVKDEMSRERGSR
jgi:prevent-host-death family protein